MGLDLKLLPQYPGDKGYSQQVLSLWRDYELFDKIKFLSATLGFQIEEHLNSYVANNEEHDITAYGEIKEDSHGKPLKYVYAVDFNNNLSERDFETSHENIAAYNYIKAVPKKTKIWLYWD